MSLSVMLGAFSAFVIGGVILLAAWRRIPVASRPDDVIALREDFLALADQFRAFVEQHDVEMGRHHRKVGHLRRKLQRAEGDDLDDDDDHDDLDDQVPVMLPAVPVGSKKDQLRQRWAAQREALSQLSGAQLQTVIGGKEQ